MKITNPIRLKITQLDEWPGGILIEPGFYQDPGKFDAHGKDPGDIRIVKSNGEIRGLVSLGQIEKFSLKTLRLSGGKIARWILSNKIDNAAIDISFLNSLQYGLIEGFTSLCEGLYLGAFQYDTYKSDEKDKTDFSVHLISKIEKSLLEDLLIRTCITCDAVNLARELAHEPPNIINPDSLSNLAKELADTYGLQCKIIDDTQLASLGANAILSVGKGSQTPSRMIILEHSGEDPKQKPFVLVGKAITFDTGGYSIKDREGIVGMKNDKSGGMDVIGVLIAASLLRLNIRVIGIIAAAENMISGEAYRPNDIIRTMAGKTVEIISTDAEGRMVLCDALTYAQKFYSPRAIVDLATLTGGVVIALGKFRAGIMGNDNLLIKEFIDSGDHTNEPLWQLPLDDEYFDLIKGDDSDIKNSGAREAHAIIGGIFLKQFVGNDTPWAHIDIAGVANTDKDLFYCPKGATGFGVRLLIDYLLNEDRKRLTNR